MSLGQDLLAHVEPGDVLDAGFARHVLERVADPAANVQEGALGRRLVANESRRVGKAVERVFGRVRVEVLDRRRVLWRRFGLFVGAV